MTATNSVPRRHVGRRALRLGAATLTAVLSVSATLIPGASALTVINGAGSTFDQPFFTLGFYEYQKRSTTTHRSTTPPSGAAVVSSRSSRTLSTSVPPMCL